jgi:uncharacterized protein (TIRG00374 family)
VAVADPGLGPSTHRSRLIRWILGLVVAAVAFAVVVELAGGIGAALDALADADPKWIALGVGFESVSFLFIALHLRRLAGGPPAVRLGPAYELALVVYGLGAVTPASPVEGVALGVQELHRKGLPRQRALFALGFSEWFSNAALLTILAVDLLLATVFADVRHNERFPAVVIAVTLVVALVIVGFIVTSKRTLAWLNSAWHHACFWRETPPQEHRQETMNRLYADRDAVLGDRRNQTLLLLLSAGAWLLDMACLEAALLAVGVHANLDQLILAYGAGILASAVPFVPAGLGLTEVAMPAVLHHYGVPLAPALAGALAYRGIGTFLPAITGGLLALGMRRRGKTADARAAATAMEDASPIEVAGVAALGDG